ncbi:hypothetical protein INT44_006316 [Umbelopsis vinacea]|uniref:Uncharacterized protein n=1 Tax=Umbelopsis vinacea TaxID=44442 RepID=A0A8H7PTA2_9FUNG|nr:hypothetical protein INT44_006316 [Umbelopsis vinacea]KAI9286305.1 hypothetical protein BC943DRAFT_304807 [Umbelopsis sp. AD052]
MNRIARNLQALKVPRGIQYRSASDSSRPFPPSHPTRPTLPENSSQTTASVSPDGKQDESTVFAPALEELTKTSKPFNLATEKLEPPRYDDFFNRHHFDTFKLLRALEQQGFTRTQAEVIMKGIKFKLRNSTAHLRQRMLTKSDLENESYLFKAALSELRTEIQVMRRNDTLTLQSEAAQITREVDALAQRLREDTGNMKSEISLDMNNRKNEVREDQKMIDMRIQEINNKFTISLGDVRTDLEAVRWETIWKGMAGVVVAGVAIASLGYLLLKHTDKNARQMELENHKIIKQLQEEAKFARTAEEEVIFSN